MREVAHAHVEHDVAQIGRAAVELDVHDIGAEIADDRRRYAQRAWLVQAIQQNARGKNIVAVLVDVPAHVEPAVGLVLERHQSGRLDGVNRDALTRRENANNPISRHRAAVRRETHGQIAAKAPDGQRAAARPVVLTRHLEHQVRRFFQAEPAELGQSLRRAGGALLGLDAGIHRAQHVAGIHFAPADGAENIFDRLAREPGQRGLHHVVGEGFFRLLESARDDLAPQPGELLAHGLARRAADRGARLARRDEPLPGGRRRLALRGDNLDLVAVAQLRQQRRDAAVELAADRVVAELGVNGVGEVDRRRRTRQRDHPALRREAKNLVVEHFELRMLEELLRAVALPEKLDGSAKPVVRPAFRDRRVGLRAHAVLVERVRRDAVFGDLVHLARADLQFDALASWSHDGRVDRAVVVLFRRRNIVLETAGHGLPARVDDAERAVAVLDGVDYDPEAKNVGQLLHRDRLVLDLAENRIGRLLAALHLGLNAALAERLDDILFDLGDQLDVVRAHVGQPRLDHRAGLGRQRFEREVLQLLAHVLHAHASGERRVDVERLAGDALALVRRHEAQRAHVVQAVGELDQQHPHIVGDSQQQLAEVLGLLGLLRNQVELLELGEALDQRGDFGAEQPVDFLACRRRVLDRVVQHRRDDRRVVEAQIGEDSRDFQRMAEIGVAGSAQLSAMRLHGVDVGAVQQVLVGVRIVFPNAIDKLVLSHHVGKRPATTGGRAGAPTLMHNPWAMERRTKSSSAARPYSASSSGAAGGTRPSRPRSRSSSVIRSN